MKAFKTAAQIPYHIPLMGAAVIPNHNHRSPKMLEKMAQEFTYFSLLDILLLQAKVKAEAVSFGAERQTRDNADSMAKLLVSDNGGQTPGRPCLSNRRN